MRTELLSGQTHPFSSWNALLNLVGVLAEVIVCHVIDGNFDYGALSLEILAYFMTTQILKKGVNQGELCFARIK